MIALTSLCLALAAGGDLTGFEEIYDEDGITVWARERPGRSLPTFRGEGMIPSHILHILAVFRDSARHTEWMYHCAESRIVKRFSELEALVYNRTDAPWPVADRDVVVHAKLTWDVESRDAWNHFAAVSTPLVPEVEGVVRMPVLEGFYHLVYVDRQRTILIYQVDADPGGLLPTWLAKLATRLLPYNTIAALRTRIEATYGAYDELFREWVERYQIPLPAD